MNEQYLPNNNQPARSGSRSRYTGRPSYRSTWASRPVSIDRDVVDEDDGYDAAKDAYLTGDGPRPHGFHHNRGY
jgi:hypothetical protein